jgi:hypothetical protein
MPFRPASLFAVDEVRRVIDAVEEPSQLIASSATVRGRKSLIKNCDTCQGASASHRTEVCSIGRAEHPN